VRRSFQLALITLSLLPLVPDVGGLQGDGTAITAPMPRKLVPERRSAAPRELPPLMDDTPSEGLTLEKAIERLLAANTDLAVKFQDIPKARADILTASLIENPSVFLTGDGIPYRNYSPQRPGQTEYDTTAVQPFDLSGKRRARIRVAERAVRVLEALYQDAVRLEIDKLYSAYLDVLEARLNLGSVQESLKGLTTSADALRDGAGDRRRSPAEVAEDALRRTEAEINLAEAEAALLQARRDLAALLAIPRCEADNLQLKGSLHDRSPLPPPVEELVLLALQTRPDLEAFRLSLERAEADLQLTWAERLDDVLVFYTPYQGVTSPSQGQQTATGWETGGLTVIPLFDRNQGELARGRVSLEQLRLQKEGLERRVVHEVQSAAAEYGVSRQVVAQYESQLRSDDGARREETVRQYLEALVRHRRSMLKFNTAVGRRILP
jgi:cobalt-zinc-cadmium efflux system outer membrane protein